jgi:hypothetical protein
MSVRDWPRFFEDSTLERLAQLEYKSLSGGFEDGAQAPSGIAAGGV